MPGPTLSPEEIAQLTAEKAKQQNIVDAYTAAIPQKEARADELAVADGGFKKFFDYYNDDIIVKYEAERKALDGQYIASPITEADIEGPASLDGSVRTTPTLPDTDIVRVAQFDGTPLTSTTTNETQHIADQLTAENRLTTGFTGGGFNPATAKTDADLTAASTTLEVTDPTNALTIIVGAVILVNTVSDMALMTVTSIITPPGGVPPYNAEYGITMIVAPSGTIPSATALGSFSGFNNTERSTKTASNTALQPLMNYLVSALQTTMNSRVSRLNEQLAAIAANLDPTGAAGLATATTNANTSKTFITNYLATTDISDTGLGTLSTERGTRGGQITARVTAINTAKSGYYDQRYTFANNRANTASGSLRLQYATEQSVEQLGAFIDGAQAAIDAIDSILP